MKRTSIEISSLSAIDHILRHRPERIEQLILPQTAGQRLAELEALAKNAGVRLQHSGRYERTSEPARALVAPFVYDELESFLTRIADKATTLTLALDHLQDPQNFGALCRSAEGLGVDAIVVPKDRSAAVGAGVYHASVGAVETIPVVQVTNLASALTRMKEESHWVVGAALQAGATPPWEMPSFEKVVLVLGAELEGLSHSIEKLCDWRLQIPLQGLIESLNVSAAGSILMYELKCRRFASTDASHKKR